MHASCPEQHCSVKGQVRLIFFILGCTPPWCTSGYLYGYLNATAVLIVDSVFNRE